MQVIGGNIVTAEAALDAWSNTAPMVIKGERRARI